MAVETLTNLTIKGYKSIRNLDNMELRRFNVLIGANGSGKSNFIDFFRMLSDVFRNTNGNLQNYVALRGRADSLLYYGAQATTDIEASVRIEGDGQWRRYSFRLSWGAPDNLTVANESLEYQREGKDASPKQKELGGPRPESAVLTQADLRPANTISTIARLFRDHLRTVGIYHFHDTSERAAIRVTQDLGKPANTLSTDGGNLWVFLHHLKEHKPANYKRIVQTVELVAPFIQDFLLDASSANPRSLLMGWTDRSGREFGPHQLSDGTLRAIALITALLQPEESMPSIMLFDEPELGLHPSAIGLVSDLLKEASENRQVIVATQSPILIRNYQPDDIIVIERPEGADGKGESTFTRLERKPLEAWLEDYDLGDLYEQNVTGGYPR
ncbi:MAG: AAA family ATPase [Capsulimonadaceae bacterium]